MANSIASRRRRSALATCASVLALLTAIEPALAQNQPPVPSSERAKVTPPSSTPIKAAAPKGFEDVDNGVSTEFDLTFQGRRIGSFTATYKNGTLSFADPAKVAAALGPDVDTDTVKAFLANPMPGNEQYRCRPGQISGCGILPGGASGVIVNADSFQVTLFLARQYLISTIQPARVIGPPTASGPSLIQGVRFSAASSGGGPLRYGGTFDTLASIGQNALVAETTLSDTDGLRAQQLYVQRVWSDRRAAVGLLQDFQSLSFTSYRIAGGEFGSFYGTLVDPDNDTATPVEVLLPKRAQVEVYRDNVLLSTAQYEAGLQLVDTRNLPDGSYTIRVVARDGGQVLLDQTRSFSKIANLVPPGKTGFRIRVGERLEDNFLDNDLNGANAFIPKSTGEFVASGSVQRRLGHSLAGNLTVTSFGSRIFSEAGLQVFRGKVTGLVSGGVGSGGVYSAQVSGSVQFPWISFFLSARTVHANNNGVVAVSPNRYEPFFRSQDNVFGSVQLRALGGSFSLTGSYTRSPQLPDRYAAGVQYTRSFRMPVVGNALLSVGATKSDFDSRFGITISFFKQIDRKTDASFSAGGQYVPNSSSGGGRTGVSPVAEAAITRVERIGPVDLTGQVGGSTDADSDRAFAQVRAQSPYGSADATAQYQTRTAGSNAISALFNMQSGFVIGGGAVKIGMRNPADSMVVLDLSSLKSDDDANATTSPASSAAGTVTAKAAKDEPTKVAAGGYRITVNSKPLDYVEPGQRVAIGLPAYKQYTIGLKPEGAPQFDLSGTEKSVTLYPGNVDRVRFQAQRIISIYGQVLDTTGHPLAGARVDAGSDYTVSDDRGYFTVTAALTATLSIRSPSGEPCLERLMNSVVNAKDPALLYRFGKLRCATPTTPAAATAPAASGPATPATSPSTVPVPGPTPPSIAPKVSVAPSRATPVPISYQPQPGGLLLQAGVQTHPPVMTSGNVDGDTDATRRANHDELQRLTRVATAMLDERPSIPAATAAIAPLSSLGQLVAQKFVQLATLETQTK